jgi:hypothetical protein
MLDSYGDQSADEAHLDHSYIAHYPSPELAIHHIGAIVRRSLHEAEALPNGPRHLVLTSCMIAMYLSKDSVRTATARVHTRTLLRSAGPVTRLLVPVLRIWRVLYKQRTT